MIAGALLWLTVLTVGLLSIYGLLGLLTLLLYWRHRQTKPSTPAVTLADLPMVTVQLPVYNERFVIERLVEAAVQLEYPRERLQIQVIDDSTDDTTEIAADLVSTYRGAGFNIDHLRRTDRQGYKAGALSKALQKTTGEYIAIFDADFLPASDFLRQTIPHFLLSPELGMIQARWGHLNAGDSALTAAQSIALDKHFVMEQTVRHRARLFPKFNGAAGVWRRTCIEDAGGWHDDTVCEDLCLSTRAIIKGWQFQFLTDVVAPAELPSGIMAYKNQQARWAKGSMQCLKKYGRDILGDKGHTLFGRLYALLSMSAYATHLLLILLLLLQVPLLVFNVHLPAAMLVFTVLGASQPLLFILAQKIIYPDWHRRILYFPALLLVAIGIAPSNARAILQAFRSGHHVFVRTPKCTPAGTRVKFTRSAVDYWFSFDRIVLIELLLALYAAVGVGLALWRNNPGPLFLLLSALAGFSYVAALGIRESLCTHFRA